VYPVTSAGAAACQPGGRLARHEVVPEQAAHPGQEKHQILIWHTGNYIRVTEHRRNRMLLQDRRVCMVTFKYTPQQVELSANSIFLSELPNIF
jgi:hypothetical protein